MSKELTLEIMRKARIVNPTTAQVINFIVTANLSQAERKDFEKLAAKLNPDIEKPFLKIDDVEKAFAESEIRYPYDFSRISMYLKDLADELDQRKSISGYENTIKLIPVEYLNKWDLPNLIGKLLSQNFWEPRVKAMSNKVNKGYFTDRTGISIAELPELGTSFVTYDEARKAYDEAKSDEEKVLALKHMISQMGGNNTDYLKGVNNFNVQEQLKSLTEMWEFLKFTAGY